MPPAGGIAARNSRIREFRKKCENRTEETAFLCYNFCIPKTKNNEKESPHGNYYSTEICRIV